MKSVSVLGIMMLVGAMTMSSVMAQNNNGSPVVSAPSTTTAPATTAPKTVKTAQKHKKKIISKAKSSKLNKAKPGQAQVNPAASKVTSVKSGT